MTQSWDRCYCTLLELCWTNQAVIMITTAIAQPWYRIFSYTLHYNNNIINLFYYAISIIVAPFKVVLLLVPTGTIFHTDILKCLLNNNKNILILIVSISPIVMLLHNSSCMVSTSLKLLHALFLISTSSANRKISLMNSSTSNA